jgi:hypothetical protein
LTIEKTDLIKQFSERLRDALIAAGYASSRSMSGVDIQKFAEMAGHSPQICRKYLRGQVIPEPSKLSQIAMTLQVSPGWLLFGDSHSQSLHQENKITISQDLLHYIFMHANALYHPDREPMHWSDFLLALTRDISQINTDEEHSKKIIDIALRSVKHFDSDD